MIFLTSDSHLSHANILTYCDRKFDTIEEHDDSLIKSWNMIVSKDDLVYHLGDFTLGGQTEALRLFARLNGRIKILAYPWHHDIRWLKIGVNGFTNYFSFSGERVWAEQPIVVLENVEQNSEGRGIPAILCHYAFSQWDRQHYGSYHFYGHSHSKGEVRKNCLDVGVDNAFLLTGEYRPFRIAEAISIAKGYNEQLGN
jgi:calcineurin-like phosphoesterase family protein